MKAAFFKEHGGAEKVLYDDYRDPVPGPDDVVVRVGA
ncbi:MAG: zinc-binding dehydrogenase, partial [Chloroflexi bacterium]